MRVEPKPLNAYPWYLRPFFWNQRRKYGEVLQPGLLWGRSPKVFAALALLFGALERRSSPLDPALRSLVTVRVSQINHCAFCVDINTRTLNRRGVDWAKITALPEWWRSDAFDERERAVLAYTEAVTRSDVEVEDAHVDALRPYFDEDGLVELTGVIAFQNMSSKFNSALDVPPQGFCQVPGEAAPRYFIDPRKFRDPAFTADGQPRATVNLVRLETLWFCTGTLCNLACRNCYIESSPRNDALAYLTAAEVAGYLDEIEAGGLGTRTIALTGGEPFMNPDVIAILEDALGRGFEVLVLTNAMKPMMKVAEPLRALHERYPGQLTLRVSADHYRQDLHEAERGARSWAPMIRGLRWLSDNGFQLRVAGRHLSDESEEELRSGYQALFDAHGVALDAHDPGQLVLFPEMDARLDVPEISEACWGKLGRSPDEMMCATSRMVLKRRGASHPVVVPCTLLPYDPAFEMSHSLLESLSPVALNHPHCAQFCVLGGASCSG